MAPLIAPISRMVRPIEHLIADLTKLGYAGLDLGGEPLDLSRDLFLAARARLGVAEYLVTQLLVVMHGVLEHRDRARQRANLIAARSSSRSCHGLTSR